MTKIKQAGMVRFFAPLIVAKHAVKHLNAGPASSIILTTGSVSERPRPDWSIIGSFATGLHGMTRSLALDLAPVRVNLISPGGVETELWNGLPEDKRKAMFKEMGESVPTGTIGKPEDVAESYIVREKPFITPTTLMLTQQPQYCMRDQNLTGSVISTNSGALLK